MHKSIYIVLYFSLDNLLIKSTNERVRDKYHKLNLKLKAREKKAFLVTSLERGWTICSGIKEYIDCPVDNQMKKKIYKYTRTHAKGGGKQTFEKNNYKTMTTTRLIVCCPVNVASHGSKAK